MAESDTRQAMSIISEQAIIGRNVQIGHFTTIYPNVEIAADVIIGDNCIIGHPAGETGAEPLFIGPGSVIRSHTILYEGSYFAQGLQTGHHVLIREGTRTGLDPHIGSFSDIEGRCTIGDYARFHSYVHIGIGSRIGHFVKIYPLVTLTNDPLPPSHIVKPVTIEDGVVLCVGVTVLPDAVMRRGSYAAAGAIVGGEIPVGAIVADKESRIAGHVRNLMNLAAGIRHPWMRHFADGYPPEARERIEQLGRSILNQ